MTTTAADYIAPDDYTGKWQITRTAANIGQRPAEWLANHAGGDGKTLILWEYSGHAHTGRQLFTRSRFVARDGNLHGYDSNGRKVIVHPADRMIRFLAQ